MKTYKLEERVHFGANIGTIVAIPSKDADGRQRYHVKFDGFAETYAIHADRLESAVLDELAKVIQ